MRRNLELSLCSLHDKYYVLKPSLSCIQFSIVHFWASLFCIPEAIIINPFWLPIGSSKPFGIAVDWVAGNLYWTETDRSSTRSRGRIVVAKLDGRYRHSLITSGLEMPSSVVVNPGRGYCLSHSNLYVPVLMLYIESINIFLILLGIMFWSDVGSSPKIESSWMNGRKRTTVISDRIGYPTGLTIDYSMDDVVYWADPKLNTIEMMKYDGSKRKVVVSGGEWLL